MEATFIFGVDMLQTSNRESPLKFRYVPEKKIPLSKEEHKALAKDLEDILEIMGEWISRFQCAYTPKSRECASVNNVKKLLNRVAVLQDDAWYSHISDEGSPY